MRWIFIVILTTLKISQHRSLPQAPEGFVTVVASEKYSSPSFLEKIFFGSNYRREWGIPVTMPVFDISKTNLRIDTIGGGHQTTSLKLVDDHDKEWVLRSVDKNVESDKKIAQNKLIKAIIQDHVSGSYPYAGLSVPDIAHAAGVPAGEQRLYFVPDDTAFGQYRAAMANKVFILVNNQPQLQKGISTVDMLEKLKSDKQYYVDPKEYLKARLVDWLVADWDRHDDQWSWRQERTDSGIAFFVVPKDRDQVFYKSNGLLVKIVALFSMPHINKFNKTGRGIKDLSKKPKELDKQFTSSLKKEEWETIIKEFQQNVSDSVIESAIKKQPPEIFAIRGNELIEKLKSRRDGLLKHVMKYHRFLQKS
jgi:hypothetical protein